MQKYDPDYDVKKINLKDMTQGVNPSSTVVEPVGQPPFP